MKTQFALKVQTLIEGRCVSGNILQCLPKIRLLHHTVPRQGCLLTRPLARLGTINTWNQMKVTTPPPLDSPFYKLWRILARASIVDGNLVVEMKTRRGGNGQRRRLTACEYRYQGRSARRWWWLCRQLRSHCRKAVVKWVVDSACAAPYGQ